MAAQRPLRILSIDGGGVRGIASLYILQELMRQVGRDLNTKVALRPCDYFDLIAGTSTGGLIAIMLGRLRYTVDEAIQHYKTLAERVFSTTSSKIDAKYDHAVLESVIKELIAKAPAPSPGMLQPDEMLEDLSVDTQQGGCRTFVVAIRTRGGNQAVRLRTYGTQAHDAFQARIWEAARATSAAPTFFSPVEIADELFGDGGTGWNNPSKEAMNEVHVLWPYRPIGCLISLGTGEEDPLQLIEGVKLPKQGWVEGFVSTIIPKQAFRLAVAKYCANCLTSCKTVHNEIILNLDRDNIRGRYFRFNTPGIGRVGLEEWEKIKDMVSLTATYMESAQIQELKIIVAKSILSPYISQERVITERVDSILASIRQSNQPIAAEPSSLRSMQDIECNAGQRQNFEPEGSSAGPSTRITREAPVASLIYVAEYFAHMSNLFKDLGKRDSSLNRLRVRIDILKTIFRQECINLVQIHGPVRTKMLDRLPSTPNPDNEIPLRRYLSREAQEDLLCIFMTTERILKSLNNAYDQFRHLFINVEQAFQSSYNFESRHEVLNYISEVLSQLQTQNSRLAAFSIGIEADNKSRNGSSRIQGQQPQEPHFSISKLPQDQIDQRLKSYHVVQKVSTQLYGALGKVCEDHEQHSAHFRLQPHHTKHENGERPYITFEIRFAQHCSQNWKGKEVLGVAWLAIESIIPDSILEDQTSSDPTLLPSIGSNCFSKRSPKRTSSVNLGPHDKRFKLTSTFNNRCDDTLSITPEPKPPSIQLNVASSKPDFCLRRDFCARFHAYGQGSTENLSRFIGYFEKSGPHTHRVYFSPLSNTWAQQHPISLADTIMTLFKDQDLISTMPYERVELAKQLASTMLQFQGTPLLNASWSSRDVMFFGRSGSLTQVRELFKGPYLKVSVDNAQELASTTSPPGGLFVYNQYLFRLAIVLIEIAYQAPLLDLRHDKDLVDLHDDENSNVGSLWLVADRLCESISAKLGRRYKAVVRKCLDTCVDQSSKNLENKVFQAMMYRDLVNELEELKQWMIDEGWKAREY